MFLIFVSFASFARNLGIAPIDADYESKIYNIYKNFHSQKLTSSQWSSLIFQREVNVYEVQKKDTLWDISKVLFDDSNYWPKLWSLNAFITNPHQIKEGNRLMLVQGTESEAPQIVIAPEGGEVSATLPPTSGGGESFLENGESSRESASSCSQNIDTILGRDGDLSRIYSREIQCSDVQNKLQERRKEDAAHLAENSDINLPQQMMQKLGRFPKSLPPLRLYLYPDIDLSGLVKERSSNINLVERYHVERSDMNSIGKVRDFDFVPIRGSEIILELDIPANVGDRYTLIRPLKKLRARNFFIRGPLGYEVYVAGTVRITGPVRNESGFYFAEIENLYNPIRVNYDVVESNPQYFDFEAPVRWGSGSAQIVGASQDQSHSFLMLHSFIYLNRGRADGVMSGDSLQIWAHPRFHKKPSKKPLGNVLVVHSSDRFSTGFVTQLISQAHIGDYLRPYGGDGFISEETEDVYDYEELESFENEEDDSGDGFEGDFEEEFEGDSEEEFGSEPLSEGFDEEGRRRIF